MRALHLYNNTPGRHSFLFPPICWTCWRCELTRPHKHAHQLWFATSLGTVAITSVMCPWELGEEGKYLWFRLEVFFPSAVTSSSCFQVKIPFAEIDFRHLRSSMADKPHLGQANDSYSGSIPLPQVKRAPRHMDGEGLYKVCTKLV